MPFIIGIALEELNVRNMRINDEGFRALECLLSLQKLFGLCRCAGITNQAVASLSISNVIR